PPGACPQCTFSACQNCSGVDATATDSPASASDSSGAPHATTKSAERSSTGRARPPDVLVSDIIMNGDERPHRSQLHELRATSYEVARLENSADLADFGAASVGLYGLHTAITPCRGGVHLAGTDYLVVARLQVEIHTTICRSLAVVSIVHAGVLLHGCNSILRRAA